MRHVETLIDAALIVLVVLGTTILVAAAASYIVRHGLPPLPLV